MSELDQKFEEAAAKMNKLTFRPTDEQLLQIYGLYKQSTVGDCNVDKPGMFQLKEKAKWEAWNKLKGILVRIGKSSNEAKEEYVKQANYLMEAYGKA